MPASRDSTIPGEVITLNPQRLSGREMTVREKGLWAQALKALDDARLSGEIQLGAGVRIDVGCCDEMLHAALAAGCRYDGDEVLAYTAAVAAELALQPQFEAQREFEWAGSNTERRVGLPSLADPIGERPIY